MSLAALAAYQPVCRFDTREWCFPDSAGLLVGMPGVQLRRADGTLIAHANLTLDYLGPRVYADGLPVAATDVLSIHGAGKDYRVQYESFTKAHPHLTNRVYGRSFEHNRRQWLLYCYAFFYNPGPLGFAAHELDWEFVLLRLNENGRGVDAMVLSQHRSGAVTGWENVELEDGHPVVYFARGSHAGYFRAGWHRGGLDRVDGKVSRHAGLEPLPVPSPGWTLWPGYWGGTIAPPRGIDQSSPRGPGQQGPWRTPSRFLANAKPWTP
jgi:hypothetical protein